MSLASTCARAGRAIRLEGLAGAGVFGVADTLRFAAAPIFAAMALFTGLDGGGSSPWLCPPTHAVSPLGGMAMMYGLMALVHAPPWLRAVSSPRPRR